MAKHYFITNREIRLDRQGNQQVREDGEELAQRTLRFGELDTTTQKPSWNLYEDLLSEKGYSSDENDIIGSAKLFTSLHAEMIKDTGGDVLFFVHGFNADLTQVGEIVKELEGTYVYPGSVIKHIVVFTWPAERTNPALHYRRDHADALESGEVLYRVFEKFKAFNKSFFKRPTSPQLCGRKIHMMCHSMAHMVLSKVLSEQKELSHIDGIFEEIFLFGANVGWDALQPGECLEYLPNLGSRVHVYFSKSDEALLVAQLIKSFEKQLGKSGIKNIREVADNVYQIDLTSIKHTDDEWADHWYYLKNELVVDDIRCLIEGAINPEDIRTERGFRKKYLENSYFIKEV